MLLGDSLLYFLGSHMGWRLLGFLCKVSVTPETCILRSAESFYKRGRATLLFAKFIPGVNTMAPPLAGSMKMPFVQFLGLDFLGATFYALVYGAIGFFFRDFVAAITRGFQAAGHVVEIVVILAAIAFVAYRVWLYRKHRVDRIVPRVQVIELAESFSRKGRARSCWSMCAAMVTTIPAPRASRARFASSPITSPRKSKSFPRTKTSTCTVLDSAKPPAPVWRICCANRDSTRLSSSVASRPGAKPANPLRPCPTVDLVHLPTFSRPRPR